MSKRRGTEVAPRVPAPAVGPDPVTPGSLAGLIVLGGLSALLSVFLWGQLLLGRQGGLAVCGPGASTASAPVWTPPFASAVHRVGGVPFAGWGLVWSLVAPPLTRWTAL